MLTPIATWNPVRSVWETTQGQLCGHSDVFSETWPSSGMTRGGTAYVRRMSVPLMGGSASSSLLKTPTAQLAVNGGSQHPDKRKEGGHGPTLADEIEHLLPTPTVQDGSNTAGPSQLDRNSLPLNTIVTLFPSPRATDGTKGGPNQRGSSGDLMLPSAVTHLLPTPSVADGMGGHLNRSGARSNELLLPGVAKSLALLPTPRSQNGEDRNQNIWERPLDQPQNLENALARLPTGVSTPPLSPDGSPFWDAPHLPLSSQDPKADNA